MEEVKVELPGGRILSALRVQDLPAKHVIQYQAMPQALKPIMGAQLFALASGVSAEVMLSGMTFAELEYVLSEWAILSAEAALYDKDGAGAGIDWSELLRVDSAEDD